MTWPVPARTVGWRRARSRRDAHAAAPWRRRIGARGDLREGHLCALAGPRHRRDPGHHGPCGEAAPRRSRRFHRRRCGDARALGSGWTTLRAMPCCCRSPPALRLCPKSACHPPTRRRSGSAIRAAAWRGFTQPRCPRPGPAAKANRSPWAASRPASSSRSGCSSSRTRLCAVVRNPPDGAVIKGMQRRNTPLRLVPS